MTPYDAGKADADHMVKALGILAVRDDVRVLLDCMERNGTSGTNLEYVKGYVDEAIRQATAQELQARPTCFVIERRYFFKTREYYRGMSVNGVARCYGMNPLYAKKYDTEYEAQRDVERVYKDGVIQPATEFVVQLIGTIAEIPRKA